MNSNDLDYGVEVAVPSVSLPDDNNLDENLLTLDPNKFLDFDNKKKKIRNKGKYTRAYIKYIKTDLRNSEGRITNPIEDKIYNIDTDRFLKRTAVLKPNGTLRKRYIDQHYQINEYGNILKDDPAEEIEQFTFFSVWEVNITKVTKDQFGNITSIDNYTSEELGETKVINCKASQLENKKKLYCYNAAKKIREKFEDSNFTVHYVKLLRLYINRIKVENIENIPMYGASVVPLSYLGSNIIHDGIIEGDCVPRALLNHLNNPKETDPNKRIKKATLEKILDLLNEKSYNPSDGLDDGLLYETNTKEDDRLYKGYNSLQVKAVCTFYRVPMYAIDFMKNTFLHNLNEIGNNRHKNIKSFVYCCSNNHLYVIDDHEFREYIMKSSYKLNEKLGAKCNKTIKKKEKYEEIKQKLLKNYENNSFESLDKLPDDIQAYKDKTIYITSKENPLTKFFYDEIKQGRIHDDNKYLKIGTHGDIISFKYTAPSYSMVIKYNPDFPLVYKICDKLNAELKENELPYNPHVLQLHTLGLEYYKRNYGHPDSQLGVDGWDIINNNLNTALNEFWKMPKNWENVHGYDQCKHYASCLYQCDMGWPVYNPMDEMDDFDGNIKTGFYYIETAQSFPLRGNGWYSDELVKECLNDKLITLSNIKYQFTTNNVIGGSHFKKFIDDVFEKFGEGAKLAINGFTGLLRKVETKIQHHGFTNNFNELCKYGIQTSFKDTKINVVHNETENVVCFHTILEKKLPYTYTNLPIYRKIYDLSILKNYRIAKQVGLKHLLGIWTDALYFEGGNILETNGHIQQIGGIRKEELPKNKIQEIKRPYVRTEHYTPKLFEWKEVDFTTKEQWLSGKGCMITGGAGTGKSYLCNKVKEYISDTIKFVVCAPTHKAAIHVDGHTIHRLFGIDPFLLTISHGQIMQLKNQGTQYIFIDEISMIPASIWGLLAVIKKRYGFTFIGFGDFYQLAPVGEEDYYKKYRTSKLLSYIFDGQCMELKINYRIIKDPQSRIFYEQLEKARLGQQVNFKLFGSKECDFAIAHTNKEVDRHNLKVMTEKAKQVGEYEKLSKDMFLFVGLPIISKVTNDVYVNNEDFIVTGINPEKITIKNERNEVKIDRKTLKENFKVFYACTVHKAQGMTIDFEFTIYGFNRMCPSMLYTALSRSTKLEYINLIQRISGNNIKGYIYMYTHRISRMSYIGSTINVEQRRRQHEKSKENDKFHKALRSFGVDAFEFKILNCLMVDSQDDLLSIEGYYIKKHNTLNQYNTDNIVGE